MIKNLFIICSKTMFAFLTRGWCLTVLIGCGVAIPIYQSFVFGLYVDIYLLLRVILSLAVSVGFYAIAYGFLKLMSQLSLALYKTDIDNFLFVLQVFLIASFFIFYWEALALPDWKVYDGVFNAYLVLLATYYGIGSYSYKRKFIPSLSSTKKDGVDKKSTKSIIKALSTLIVVIALLFSFQLHRIHGLKSELYEKAVLELKVNQTVFEELGRDLSFSTVVTGKVKGDYGRLHFNLVSQGKTLIVNVKGKAVNGNWIITHLALMTPNKTIQLKADPDM